MMERMALMNLNRRTLLAALCSLPLGALAQFQAQKPVKIVVNLAAGGPLDVLARALECVNTN